MSQTSERRAIPLLTFTLKPIRRTWITLSGCNFDCKACFTIAKRAIGRLLSVEEILKLFSKSCKAFYGKIVGDAVITGGEPTLNADYLVSLVLGLKECGVQKVVLKTNGSLLDKNLLNKLESVGLDCVSIDLKAYDDGIHRWYTGKSNSNVLKAIRSLHCSGLEFRVETLFMPGIIDLDEIENIAKFLCKIDRRILFKLNEFAPEYTNNNISRRPTQSEMLMALNIAKRFLDNVIGGKSCSIDFPKTGKYEYVKVYANGVLKYIEESDRISTSKYDWKIYYLNIDEVFAFLNDVSSRRS